MTRQQLKLAADQAACSLDHLQFSGNQLPESFAAGVLSRLPERKKTDPARLAACLLLALALAGGTLLGISSEIRASVRGWFNQEVPVAMQYKVDGSNTHIPDYRLGYMPEGFTQANPVDDGGSISIRYFGTGGKAHFLAVRNNWLFYNALQLESGGKEPTVKTVRLRSGTGHYYTVKDGRDAALVWYNEEHTTVFCITGPFTKKTMMKIADSLYVENEEDVR